MGTFEDYLKFEVTEAQEDEKQLRIIEKISLSEETEKAIKGIDKDILIEKANRVYSMLLGRRRDELMAETRRFEEEVSRSRALTMHTSSSITIIASEPSIEPALEIES